MAALARLGIEALDENPNAKSHSRAADLPYIEDRKERYKAWYAESLLTGLRNVEAGDRKMAFRCYAQVCEYHGQLGWAPEGLGDAAAVLRNAIEGYLQ